MIETFDDWKCRASSLGRVVTKSGKLTDDAKTYLMEVFIGELYGVKKEAYGKALEKGVACEPDGIKMLNDTLYPGRYLPNVKNSEGGGRENEFTKGTSDTIIDEYVYDIKNAWDRFTFGKAELTHLHEWQLKDYMWLYDKPKGRIFYCLNNMPEHMIIAEEDKLYYTQRGRWTSREDSDYLKACEELRAAHNYDNMPIHHRFKLFDVEFTEEDKEKIISCVNQARSYLNALFYEHKTMLIKNLTMMQDAVVEG